MTTWTPDPDAARELFGVTCRCGYAPEHCRCPQEGQDDLFGTLDLNLSVAADKEEL